MNQLDGQHNPGDETHDPIALVSADEEALNALIDADYRVSEVTASLSDRCTRLAGLLGLLEVPAATLDVGRETLIGKTVGMLGAAQNASAAHQTDQFENEHPSRGWINEDDSMLAAADRDALEALIGAGLDPSRVAHGVRDRAQKQLEILALVNTGEPFSEADRSARVERTLAFVQSAIDTQSTSFRFPAEGMRRVPGAWRIGDFVAAAAVLAIGVGVLWPMLTSSRDRAQQAACLGNFSALKTAFGQYGGDNTDSLPMATASLAGHVWWNVGKPSESNAANTFHLSKSGYATLEQITCPCSAKCLSGKPNAAQVDFGCMNEVSYSMQNLFASHRPMWSKGERTVILGDRSPVTLANMNKTAADPTANSPNHGGRGQNILWNDGSAQWVHSPMLPDGENIWLPQPTEMTIITLEFVHDSAGNKFVLLKGVEEPSCEKDAFLGP